MDEERDELGLPKKPVLKDINFMLCPRCNRPLGQKGDSPARSVRLDGRKILVHGDCK